MKILTTGASHWGSQRPRIDDGFRQLGHEITYCIDEADLIYSNNPPWDGILEDQRNGIISGKIIFNVLDIPTFLPDFDIPQLRRQLLCADAITSISQFTHDQVVEHCGLESSIIYQPIKPVARQPELAEKPFYRFAHVGRRSDINKYAVIGIYALQILGYHQRDLCLVGNEPGPGDYLGVLSDENLNIVYNSVDFVLCTSKTEGLCLPALESMAAGAIPVVCNHLSTLNELFPADIFPEYRAVEPHPASVATFIARYLNDSAAMEEMKNRLHAHYLKNWADKTRGVDVAQAILNVYEKIK